MNQFAFAFGAMAFLYYCFDPINQMWHEPDVFNGTLYLLFLPAFFTLATLLIVFLVGLPLRIIATWRYGWQRHFWPHITCIGVGVLILWLAGHLHINLVDITDMNGEVTHKDYVMKYLPISCTGWLIAAFGLMHASFVDKN